MYVTRHILDLSPPHYTQFSDSAAQPLYSTSFQLVLLPIPSIISEPLCCLCSQVVSTSWICDGTATTVSFSVGNVTEAHEHARHVLYQ